MIRPARPTDVVGIASLSGELGYPSSEMEIQARLEALATSEHFVCVAEDDGAIIGWCHVCLVKTLESEMFAEIRGLIVTEGRRGEGIGASLIESALMWASSRSCTRIRVRSNIKRTATRQFYENRGFTVVKTQNAFEKRLTPSSAVPKERK